MNAVSLKSAGMCRRPDCPSMRKRVWPPCLMIRGHLNSSISPNTCIGPSAPVHLVPLLADVANLDEAMLYTAIALPPVPETVPTAENEVSWYVNCVEFKTVILFGAASVLVHPV